jgi:hypothetical protein
MAQVVNVDAFQADSGDRRTPDPPPEVGVGQRCALGAGERESTGRNRAEVLAQVGQRKGVTLMGNSGRAANSSSCGKRARLARVWRMIATTMAPTIPASMRTAVGTAAATIHPAMLEPNARWLPGGAAEDVAWTRNLPDRVIGKLRIAAPAREPNW